MKNMMQKGDFIPVQNTRQKMSMHLCYLKSRRMAPLEASVWLQIINLWRKLKLNPIGLISLILIDNHPSDWARVVEGNLPSYGMSYPALLHLGFMKAKENIRKQIGDTVHQLDRE